MPSTVLMKLKHRFTFGGAAASGTCFVTEAGGNIPSDLFADSQGNSKYENNQLGLDSSGSIEVWVAPGNYRLTLKDVSGQTLSVYEKAMPYANTADSEPTSDAPPFQELAYSSTIVPNATNRTTYVRVGTLTGNVTVAAPLNPAVGKILIMSFTQDGTGSRTITWNAAFSLAGANGAGTANQVGITTFVYNGTKWLQSGGALAFHAA